MAKKKDRLCVRVYSYAFLIWRPLARQEAVGKRSTRDLINLVLLTLVDVERRVCNESYLKGVLLIRIWQ